MSEENFKFTFNAGGTVSDVADIYVKRDYFSEGGLWLCGTGKGAFADNSVVSRSSPVQTVSGGTDWKQVSFNLVASAAIKTNGTLWLWGCGLYGQLGEQTSLDRSSPVQTVSGGTDWKQVSTGSYSIAAIKTDGTLWLWGHNNRGQLGKNTGATASVSSPVQTVSGGTDWKYVSMCSLTAAAIKTDGTLWLWGDNTYGQLAINITSDRSSPVQTVSGGTDWKQISIGCASAAAIKTDGSLWLWGKNTVGELGDASVTNKSSPVQTVSGGANWKQVAVGENNTAAIKIDGSLWVWGEGSFGALGNNTITNTSSPVQTVSGGTNWKQVSVSNCNMSSIKSDGSLWNWGFNLAGNLGNNAITNTSSPVQTVSGGTDWKQVSGFAAVKYSNDTL